MVVLTFGPTILKISLSILIKLRLKISDCSKFSLVIFTLLSVNFISFAFNTNLLPLLGLVELKKKKKMETLSLFSSL